MGITRDEKELSFSAVCTFPRAKMPKVELQGFANVSESKEWQEAQLLDVASTGGTALCPLQEQLVEK